MFPIQVTIPMAVLILSFPTAMAHFPPMGSLQTPESIYMRALPGMLGTDSSGESHYHTLRDANAWDRAPHGSAGHILRRSVENGRLARRTLTSEQVQAMVKKLNEEIGQLHGTDKSAGTRQLEERKPKVVKAMALLEKEGRADDARKLQTAFSRYTKATEDVFNVFSKDSEGGRKSPSSLGSGTEKGFLPSGKGKRR
ncbi:hypothetical protein MMC10_007087 [Thelotrema lepadinum]|nr:hypothetical protein [Thelotrema lepadinum]